MANKVLIVDGDPSMLDLLEQVLSEQGYAIERAEDGEEALQKVEAFRPDIVLLDYTMPKMDGIEVVRRLRQEERYRGLPVILVTGRDSQEDKVKGLDAGADDYVIKPFDVVELQARVRSMIRIKEMRDSLEEWNRTLEERVRRQVEEIGRVSRIKRYLSPQVAEAILRSEGEDPFKTHRREITAVFLDLRGFTAFTEGTEPEEVIEFLRGYHAAMGRVIFQFEGTLEHFAGDGIMVFFNDPIPREDHTEQAVRMALALRARAGELRPGWLKRGYDLDLGVGVAAGYATLGTVGFEGRMDYGAVGNVTVLASRLSTEAKGGQVLTNQKTLGKVEHMVEAEPLGELRLKGFARPVSAFNIAKLRG